MDFDKPALHVAWTVDDGPSPFTGEMLKCFITNRMKKQEMEKKAEKAKEEAKKWRGIANQTMGKDKKTQEKEAQQAQKAEKFALNTIEEADKVIHRPATWYIVRDKLNPYIDFYRGLQEQGHEIAIHGLHSTQNHLAWFPSQTKPSYKTLDEALKDLRGFHSFLIGKQINVKFVRLPGGLLTEVSNYLQMKEYGFKQEETGTIARDIIIGKEVSKKAQTIVQDFERLKNELGKIGLRLWGGKPDGGISSQSWEAESAPPHRKKFDNIPNVANALMAKLPTRATKMGSLVILCHDNSNEDVTEVNQDIGSMEQRAKSTGVKIVYHTMSSLYRKIVGQVP